MGGAPSSIARRIDGGRWLRRVWLIAVIACAGAASAQNPIAIENALPGNPPSEWEISGAGDASIQGFATDISVNRGQTVSFKISTPATSYRIDIYRLGYYGGLGARHVATVLPSVSLPQVQPACLNDAATGLVDCGNWAVSASWAVPASAVSGVYVAKLVRQDPENGRASHIVFVIRDDSGGSALLFQTSDTTWQAYNEYGGNSLYTGAPAGRAYKVSYNRPFTTRETSPKDWLFNAEYPMIRWLERNGYDVSYFTGVDADRHGAEILEHQVYLSVGHDEYWSGGQRSNVETARDAGVHLAFFSGNAVFWKTRWEGSIDASATPYRTLVAYKETHANAKIDPLPTVWTGTWRDARFSPPADGGRPENALMGTIFTVDCCSYPMTVPAADGKMRFWRNTTVATLDAGQVATLADDTVGYEWDEDLDNGARPPGLVRLSSTTVPVPERLVDNGSTFAPGVATHRLVMRRASSGALVFGAGTIQWSWGLDATHDRGNEPADPRMKQATVNLLADMGVQPATLEPGLVAATESLDHTPPSSVIMSPANGFVVQSGVSTTVSGTAADGGGGVVGGVEVSVDGGLTWHPATGRASWSYAWTPSTTGAASIRSRAVDDSGNLGAASAAVSGTVEPGACLGCLPVGEGPGGPILVITSPVSPFGRYYAEILLAEGLNAFDVVDIGDLTPADLAAHAVAILAEMPLNAGGEGSGSSVATMLGDWVAAGGTLIAMRPDPQLAPLLGLTPLGTTLSNGYMLIHTGSPPGAGLVSQTIQFHGPADRHALNGATVLATLYSNASTPTSNPAVTIRPVGANGGVAAAFTYDLARSVVYTRQGNPAWAGQERDGVPPIRSNDLFYGPAAGDPQPNWIDLNKVAIPQADEQQRLLANLILRSSALPLPRFWYFPRDERAVVIQTGDHHGCCEATVERFLGNLDESPAGCSLDDWECVRTTSYIYASEQLEPGDAAAWDALGFEIGVHLLTDCEDWTPATLADALDLQLAEFQALYPSIPRPVTNRTHCIAWSDWATQAKLSSERGVRLDANYYYWPPAWAQNRPGFFTGSGMIMRFADLDGSLIDAYQAATQMTDESGQIYPLTVDTLLDRALGSQGYYGAFVTNMHTDIGDHPSAAAVVASAQARGVPLITARQMLRWLDGRNSSAFTGIAWNGYALAFAIAPGANTAGLRAMLPPARGTFPLVSLTRNGAPWTTATQTIKGTTYKVFDAAAGAYVATYAVDADGDGSPLPADCNDQDPAIHPGAVEVCNGIDDNCNGITDENNPGGGVACATGQPGVCAAGTRQCLGGALQCIPTHQPSAEVCDGLDNDCDGAIDEGNPGGGGSCQTGQSGVCAAGTMQCTAGALQCIRHTNPSAEMCDGLDNDCDGAVDEGDPGGGGACLTGEPGVCSAGVRHCVAGVHQCVRLTEPGIEVCNAIDDNCDGSIDEGLNGATCETGLLGACAAGTAHCLGGNFQCKQNLPAAAETCNGVDDDCDGEIDENDPGGGVGCDTGLPGVCAAGITTCREGVLVCRATAGVPETCNGIDDDCDGVIDNVSPDGAGSCDTGALGACGEGRLECQHGALACVATKAPTVELCGTGSDENCDGTTDEPACELCLPEDTVVADGQTARSVLRRRAQAGRVATRGAFRIPAGMSVAPDAEPVTLRIHDTGGDYLATIPAGEITRSPTGRSFRFDDAGALRATGGMQKVRMRLRGDQRDVRYAFKARGMSLPPFAGGMGSLTIRIGNRCFTDSVHLCTPNASGVTLKCQ